MFQGFMFFELKFCCTLLDSRNGHWSLTFINLFEQSKSFVGNILQTVIW